MPTTPKLIEPIPATMKEVVRSFFANDPKPKKLKTSSTSRAKSSRTKK